METEPIKMTKRELVKALQVAESTYGPDHLNTAHALKDLARYLYDKNPGKPIHKDAESLCRRMVKIIEINYGENSIEFSDASFLHAEFLMFAGQIEKAASVAFQSWQICRKHLGDDHEDIAKRRAMFMEYIAKIEDSGRSCMLNLNSKTALADNLAFDCPAINIHTAIWALRAVLANPRSSMLARDVDDFLKLVGAHLIWPSTALEILLNETQLDEDHKNEFREHGFQEMCLRFEVDLTSHEIAIHQALRRLARRKNQTLTRVIKTSLAQLEQQIDNLDDPVMKNVRLLQVLLGLSEVDCALLNFSGSMLQSQNTQLLATLIQTRSFDDALHCIATVLGVDAKKVADSLRASGLLVEFGLIWVDHDTKNIDGVLNVQANVQECLTEFHEDIDKMMLHFVSPAKQAVLTSDDYPHLDTDRLMLNRFLTGAKEKNSARVNILCYGEPGTGKTEFVKMLAREAGFKLYEVASANKLGGSLSRVERLTSLRISLRFLEEDKKALLLFDEIEDIFPVSGSFFEAASRRNPTNYGKAWMNHILENNSIPVIWISNSIDQIDPAYLRRFSYHMEFRKPPLKVRQRIAEKYLESTPVSREFVGQVAQQSGLTPALIENAARVVSLSGVDDRQEAERLVSKAIQQSKKAMGINGASDCHVSPTGYQLDYLNVDSRYPIEKIAESLKINPSATMCFYGLPGTGKTALAKHLAGELDRPLLAKRASDIISKWLGESEKNIAEMFREAEAEGAILFLDEADSFLRNRETTTKSWEVSQVNELLQQMERFNGIFICATNLFADLDAAALRRFTFKISFKAMTPVQREKMFVQEALLGEAMRLDDAARRRLHRLDALVPGDFAVVKRQSRMMGAMPTPDEFLSELESECGLKSNKQSRMIGFIA